MGQFSHEESMRFFVPPRSGKLQDLVDSGAFASPRACEIHVGQNDWQSIPANVIALMSPLGIEVVVVPGNGHNLDREYVSALLDAWLN